MLGIAPCFDRSKAIDTEVVDVRAFLLCMLIATLQFHHSPATTCVARCRRFLRFVVIVIDVLSCFKLVVDFPTAYLELVGIWFSGSFLGLLGRHGGKKILVH